MLDQKRLKEVFQYDGDSGLFSRNKAIRGQKAGVLNRRPNAHGYIVIQVDGKLYYAHRLAWLYQYGNWPVHVVDHKNGIRHDNRISNLRECSQSENACNSPARTGKLKGAFWSKQIKRWFASISIHRKQHYLGTFDSEIDAHEAYIKAANQLHGEFANTSSDKAKLKALKEVA